MNKEGLKYIITQFVGRPLPRTHPRKLVVPVNTGKIVALTGVRRSGKTFLMFDTMQRLIESGVERRQIIYINFEDDRLYPVKMKDLDLILIAHSELYPELSNQPVFLFLDEIETVVTWEKYVRRVYDTENVNIIVTGSTSRLLTREVASSLRGRSISYEVFPLDFREFTEFLGYTFQPYDRKLEAQFTHALEQYISWGGWPEIVLADEAIKPLILEEYASVLFYRDLVERYSIRNEKLMKMLLKYCCSNPATLLSVNKLYHNFRSMGLQLSKNTLYEYLEYMTDSYVLFLAPKYDRSVRKQEQNPRKIHLIDTALTQAFSALPQRDAGHKLENALFLHERRNCKELFYYANAHEIDIVVESVSGTRLINATWSLSDRSVADREYRATEWGLKQHPEATGFVVAHELGDHAEGGEPFETITAWRYLLGESKPH